MSVNYERQDNLIFRNGVLVGNIQGNGEFECTEDGQRYRNPIANFLKGQPSGDEDDVKKNSDLKHGNLERITTTRQLVAAMQPYVSESCPEMTHYEGDRTPEVLAWIQANDEVRRNVLHDHNLEMR